MSILTKVLPPPMKFSTGIKLESKTYYFVRTPKMHFEELCYGNLHNDPKYGKQWVMVTFVKSTINNFKRRTLIRDTWGSVRRIERGMFHTIFIVGVGDADKEALLEEEQRIYGDILQISLQENYQQIGVKTLAGMKWASENLPSNYYYSTSDDDMWIDMLKVTKLIGQYREVVVEKEWPEFPIICMFGTGFNEPIRDVRDKNSASKQQYPWPYWPKYCLGGMYTTSVSVIGKLKTLIQKTEKYYNLDDVWITGLLRQKLAMPNELLVETKERIAKHFVDLVTDSASGMEWKLDLWEHLLVKLNVRPYSVCMKKFRLTDSEF
ncbi:beta-1,3-galactosyltransferase 5-like [Clavelina lepadiformis]|uniref:beta-1,3-galactosyltransferase 5-like n=1 Tax=Clavelina lepadiformis TaxID=159417 RepID=UPI004040FC29